MTLILAIDSWSFRHAFLYVDLNGNKKAPNELGKDVFVMQYYEHNPHPGIYDPVGLSMKGAKGGSLIKTDANWGCVKQHLYSAGGHCGALIQENNWKMPDDYPW